MIIPQRTWEYLLEEETPNTGPPGAAPYVPGSPGAQWTNEEVLSTRLRIFQMIHPNWNVRKKQGTWNGLGPVTDIVIISCLITIPSQLFLGSSNREHADEISFP